MLLNKGVSIIATGDHYYGRMAFNLAKTIKAIDKNCPVQLITHGNALNPVRSRDHWVFDIITHADIGNGFEAKLHIDKLTAFENCLLLDADCAWVSKVSPVKLIEQLSEKCFFTSITEGYFNIAEPEKSDVNTKYYFWADVPQLISEYALVDKIYQWRTEVMFLKQCTDVTELFESARYIHAHAQEDLDSLKLFAHHIPDELCINVAACIHRIHPHQYKWQPSFWHRLHSENTPPIETLQSNYYILSCGSNMTSPAVKKLYDRIVKAASYKLGMQHVFELINKKQMMPSRQQM
jgi:hypothetical protein